MLQIPCRIRPASPRRFAVLVLVCASLVNAQTTLSSQQTPLTERERALLQRIEDLEKRVAALEGKATPQAEAPRTSVLGGAATGAAATTTSAASNSQPEQAVKQGLLGLPGTTLNFYF